MPVATVTLRFLLEGLQLVELTVLLLLAPF